MSAVASAPLLWTGVSNIINIATENDEKGVTAAPIATSGAMAQSNTQPSFSASAPAAIEISNDLLGLLALPRLDNELSSVVLIPSITAVIPDTLLLNTTGNAVDIPDSTRQILEDRADAICDSDVEVGLLPPLITSVCIHPRLVDARLTRCL